MDRRQLATSIALALAGLVVLVVTRKSEVTPQAAPPAIPTIAPSPSSSVASVGSRPSDSVEVPTVSRPDAARPGEVAKVDVGSPEATVETQLELLRRGEDDAFATTFLPGVLVTQEAIAACKKRISSVAVRPDWEMAQERVVDNHRVRRVSIFGKSMTGFHQIGRRWLADTVWCVPTGLP